MEIKDKILNYIKKHNLIKYGDKIICAVSGGADSVCMLDILVSLKEEFSLSLVVAHLNHNLRGKESLRDEEFVNSLCKEYSIPFYSKSVDVSVLSQELNISCEETGRIARYTFFKELKEELRFKKIATAHNKNDNVETVLMRIFRGTDLKGLCGIPSFNDIGVIRPLLCLSRKEIEEYLKCKGINFVTDSTNFENDFTRNKLRNTLIPMINTDYNENFCDTFSSNIEVFNDANKFIENYVNNLYEKSVKKADYGNSFKLCDIIQEDAYVLKRLIKKTIFELCDAAITTALCDNILKCLYENSSVSINNHLDFYVKYDTAFFVLKKTPEEFSYKIDSTGTFFIPEISSYVSVSKGQGDISHSDKNTIYLDCNKVSCNFILRSKKDGDKMNLTGCGTKKIKDIFIDEKIPSFLRYDFPVLEYKGDIIWLCGVRDDTKYRANSNENYIKITIHKENNHE